ncbi:MAG: glycosyltransferase family 2 protein, partial [Actinomycetota bacterium]
MPLFNEAKTIERTLEELDSNLTKHFYEPIFFIQNDASTDSSLQVIQSLSLFTQGKVQVESNPANVGHGPSVMRALHRALRSNQEIVLHVDSDGDLDFESVVKCVDLVREGRHDVVIGARVGRNDPLYREIVTRFLRFALFMLFGVASKDVNSPIRVYRHGTLARLLKNFPE